MTRNAVALLQALLDVYTIKREIGRLENFSIGLVGDLANGRTVRSLAYLLSMYPGVKMYFVAPEVVRMKEDIKDYLTRCTPSHRRRDAKEDMGKPGCTNIVAAALGRPRQRQPCLQELVDGCALTRAAVLLQERHRVGGGGGLGSHGRRCGCAVPDTHSEGASPLSWERMRITLCKLGKPAAQPLQRVAASKHAARAQHIVADAWLMGLQERFLDRLEDYAAARGKYIIDKQLMKSLKQDAVIMHPLPRVDEVCAAASCDCCCAHHVTMHGAMSRHPTPVDHRAHITLFNIAIGR
jgi:Aspartate/ornithine carbamoyltransferase, Asp/Orn binding domain